MTLNEILDKCAARVGFNEERLESDTWSVVPDKYLNDLVAMLTLMCTITAKNQRNVGPQCGDKLLVFNGVGRSGDLYISYIHRQRNVWKRWRFCKEVYVVHVVDIRAVRKLAGEGND